MGLPESMIKRTVVGTLADVPDGAMRWIAFSASDPLIDGPGNTVVPEFTVAGVVNADGTFTAELPVTEQAGWSPSGWTYEVLIGIGSRMLSGRLPVPDEPGTLDFAANFIPWGSPEQGTFYLTLASRGAPGGVAALDADGDVTDADGNKITGGGGGGGSTAWADITGKPSAFPPAAHQHAAADITTGTLAIGRIPTGTSGTTVALGSHTHTPASIGAEQAGAAVTSMSAHVAAADPHGQYALETDVSTALAGKANTAHQHAAADLTSGTLDIARIPSLPTSQVTGLDTALAAKANTADLGAKVITLTSGAPVPGGTPAGTVIVRY